MNSQQILRNELKKLYDRKVEADPFYTKEQFAIDLKLHRVNLSKFLSGKATIGRRSALKHFKKKLSSSVWKRVELEFNREDRGGAAMVSAVDAPDSILVKNQSAHAELYYSDPFLWTLLFCLELEDGDSSVAYLAKRVRSSAKKVNEGLKVLSGLGLISKTGDGKYSRVNKIVLTTDGVRDRAFDKFNSRINQRFARVKKAEPTTNWDEYCWVCAMDPADLPRVKKLVRETISTFEKLQLRSRPKRVYAFKIALIPMSD